MTSYFKVYLTSKTGKISKRIKPKTDVAIGYGAFYKECKVRFVENLEVDWRVVGSNVVDWDKYKKAKEGEER